MKTICTNLKLKQCNEGFKNISPEILLETTCLRFTEFFFFKISFKKKFFQKMRPNPAKSLKKIQINYKIMQILCKVVKVLSSILVNLLKQNNSVKPLTKH